MAGIYVHIPFCKQACYYCDFHFSTNSSQQAALVEAIKREIELRAGYLDGSPIETLYFGGGTPTLLGNNLMEDLWETVHRCFSILPDAEITVEGNPDDLTPEKLGFLKGLGVNRLSVGIQSFDEEVLRWMNRAHSAKEALTVVDHARAAGFGSLSLDLIYGVPVGAKGRWQRDLQLMLERAPDHISAYCLTIEPDTVFGRRQAKGQLSEAPEDDIVSEYDLMISELSGSGFEHYEVSNFAQPGRYSRHNTNYWRQVPYLGLGPSAHSYDGNSRSFAVANNAQYIKALAAGEWPGTVEKLSVTDRVNEYLLTSLRTQWGCDIGKMQNTYGLDFDRVYHKIIQEWEAKGLAFRHDGALILTEHGMLLADGLVAELFLGEDEM